jgi:hypothetical protein
MLIKNEPDEAAVQTGSNGTTASIAGQRPPESSTGTVLTIKVSSTSYSPSLRT